MSINFEIKGNLARLLATENLIVEHRQVETAQFNVEDRILTLPMWERASGAIFDMLVGHEVGHALFTPSERWEKRFPKIPFDFVNVIEDARIEKLIKRRYPGINRCFYQAYNELHEQDFFCVKNDDLTTYGLIDRINLYYKVGAHLDIQFNDQENEFITRISNAETFEQVLEIARDIHEYVQQTEKKEEKKLDLKTQDPDQEDGQSQPQSQQQSGQSDDGDSTPNPIDIDEKQEDQEESDDDSEQDTTSHVGSDNSQNVSKTQRAFDQNSEKLVDRTSKNYSYVTFPELKYDDFVFSLTEIHDILEDDRKTQIDNCGMQYQEYYDLMKKHYQEFKKQSQPEVSYMVKEFEMKKSASAYARTSVSKTGVLDCAKLHTYKYNEDIFKKIATTQDGKNHGLIFILDWSGSMNNILLDSYKQILSLLWFCKKVNIPFDVFCFTNDAAVLNRNKKDFSIDWNYYNQTNVIGVNATEFQMVKVLSSDLRSADLERCMLNMWYQIYAINHRAHHCYQFGLSGTPFVEAAVTLNTIIPEFRKKTKVDKLHCVFFTDGEGAPATIVKKVKRPWDNKEKIRAFHVYHERVILRNTKNGKSYNLHNSDQCQKIMQAVSDNHPGVSFINFRVLGNAEFAPFYYRFGCEDFSTFNKARELYKKSGFIEFQASGFDHLYGIQSSKLNVDTSFEIKEDVSHAQLKSSFRKMFKNKKANKKLLTTFMGQIA